MTNKKTINEPLFRIAKKGVMPTWKVVVTKAIAVGIGLLLTGLLFLIIYGANPINVYYQIINGTFILPHTFNTLLKDTALLLGVGIALIPSYKMKFWNLGGNGQVLMGALVACACIQYIGGAVPNWLLLIIMAVSAIVVGAIWAVIPAIFKAYFNTNESLFTLMMNYIAVGLVSFFIAIWVKSGSGSMVPSEYGHLPSWFGNDYLFIILSVVVLTGLMTVYMNFTKHGYEISVVGDSQNTARYVGINVKKVIIRTLVLSGAVCGFIGFLLTGINTCVSENIVNNMGFTAIIAVWIANMNPLISIATSFGICFLTTGISQVQSSLSIYSDEVSSMIIGLIYLIIIGSDFFITYAIKLRSRKKKEAK